ncbi:MAG: DNA-3-methyladenine glycosylase I [Candidatus Aenigmarchaeota archaeon]|nr:DNA-3-methyladenine glycosylase I [Candidatus Aenigmarchaeota archaeon]
MKTRCEWCLGTQLMIDYHDKEWGASLHDDQKLFEFLVLDTFQAGLSWSTILNKRENFRKAFDNFNPNKITKYDQKKIDKLLSDSSIIRNRLKINATIINAKNFLQIQKDFGSFDTFIWNFVGGKTKINSWKNLNQIPAKTPHSNAMSKELTKRGFRFMGSTICYAFMQAIGIVNDHVVDCFRYNEVSK